jgi:hypothetical protein
MTTSFDRFNEDLDFTEREELKRQRPSPLTGDLAFPPQLQLTNDEDDSEDDVDSQFDSNLYDPTYR